MAKKAAGKKQGVSNEDMFEVLVFLKDKVVTIDEKVDTLTNRVDTLTDRVDTLTGRADNTEGSIRELRERVGNLEKGQTEILDILRPLSKAHDKDTTMLLSHERRIGKLEKVVLTR